MKRAVWAVVLAMTVAVQPAWAARLRVHEAAESAQYGRKLGGMIGRGALNVVTSFVDVVVNTVNETKAGPPFVGTLTGLGRGVGCGVLRLGSGAVDLVTFWVPGFNGFPVSDSYTDCFAGTSASSELPPGYSQPSSTWDVPTAEPGAASGSAEPAKKKSWSK